MKGIIAYLLTPCDARGEVDHALLARHAERLIGQGVHGLAPLGSVGCLPYLDDGERDAVVRTVIDTAAGRVPVVAGVSSLTTAGTVRHARYAEQVGATAIQVLPSTYWKLTEDELFAYYRAVCEAVSIPVMAYNNPFTTGMDLPVAFLRRLADLPNITMLKEASPDATKIGRLRERLRRPAVDLRRPEQHGTARVQRRRGRLVHVGAECLRVHDAGLSSVRGGGRHGRRRKLVREAGRTTRLPDGPWTAAHHHRRP